MAEYGMELDLSKLDLSLADRITFIGKVAKYLEEGWPTPLIRNLWCRTLEYKKQPHEQLIKDWSYVEQIARRVNNNERNRITFSGIFGNYYPQNAPQYSAITFEGRPKGIQLILRRDADSKKKLRERVENILSDLGLTEEHIKRIWSECRE